ncbi:putative ATP-dependent RNA helicase DHR1 [Friedmanniomyces endolithicus]|nr:putative ATP-dependent RNA helicase DHR1 [Friedmanniomyces endolithicus]
MRKHQSYNRAHATLSRWDDQSDVLKLLTAVAVHADASGPSKPISALSKICTDYYLREKGMSELQQLRHQLHNIVSARYPAAAGTIADALPVPSEKERKMLGQVVAAAYIDQVAIRADLLNDETTGGFGRKPRRAGEVAYRALVPTAEADKTLPPQEQEMQRSVFVHPSSVLAHLSVKEMPGYIVYSHLSRAAPTTIDSGKIARTRMHPLTAVSAQVLAALAEGTPLLEIGKPIGKIEGLGAGRRQCWVSMSLKAPSGSNSWPLSAWKVVQRKGKRGDWEVEKVVAR